MAVVVQQQSSDDHIQLKRRFADFLERDYPTQEDPNWNYIKAVAELFSSEEDGGKADQQQKEASKRLMVAEHHLRDFDESLLQRLLTSPAQCFSAFEEALRDLIKSDKAAGLAKLLTADDVVHVGLSGDFGRHEVSPRDLDSSFLGKLVCVFGIVTKCSLVRPKLVKSTHYCETTKAFTVMEYRDVTAMTGAPTNTTYPTKDEAGNLLSTEFGLCKFKDNQTITIQELPETAPPGQLPHSTEVVLEDDLVDKVKPGDRVALVGVYKALAGRVSGQSTGVFRSMVVGIAVHKITKEGNTKYTAAEARLMRKVSEREDVLSLLARSLAPSIFGHDAIKRGLVLQLFGGLEKNLENGTHLRGDINCLLVGDPGVAKSQMLRAVMNIAPHAVSTTGRGSSGVGLTAAVTMDRETGEKRLEAGAMVLADKGVVCIDEFDKMSDQDRVAIHEVMEQQTVTIAKAGIHTSLNARCSVLAAANPLYGSYDKSISVTRNVNLPDSLLSRFDMLFVVLDCMTESRDRQMAMHVLAQHRYRPEGDNGKGAPMQETIHDRRLSLDAVPGAEEPSIFLKHDTRLHGDQGAETLTADFLRKYIVFARRRYNRAGVKIAITDEAAQSIVEYYSELRRMSRDRALPVTARSLETIIRLATASCKVRLSFTVEQRDVEVAQAILDHCLKKNIGDDDEPEQAEEEPQEDDIQDEDDNDDDDDQPPQPPADRPARGQKRGRGRSQGPSSGGAGGAAAGDGDGDDEDGPDGGEGPSGAAAGSTRRASKRAATTTARHAVSAAVAASGLVPAGAAGPSTAPTNPSTQRGPSYGGVSLSSQQLATMRGAIESMMDEYTEDTIPVEELQVRLDQQGLQMSEPQLIKFLNFCSDNYDRPEYKGVLPALLYIEDARSFVVCS